ncbi:YebC/PmpR family DNA-binding transcriptional regulator [Telmatocola sphagniphila]|uniref:Probable transcriptional regulatory protein KIH39_22460 n=1 Tax=Telmatocola sphagniphila TaxID=1123043 RepID=A0A8E6B6R2_9BACT|nr:YebC/PmpR family DNA-binding transcriptional regulator [Telmatocola sphagniphila]QVL31578.1 YebC/PmpR family DNA-binding transcriptional regulator [Telmatocola sphagniphila]
MAGHSHSANIAVRKGKQDAQRAKLFSKLSRYIIIAARAGGGDPDTNLKLRYAIDKARSVSMPRDNIERAIKRGTGEAGSDIMEELNYEGYGPGGVAIFCDILTDNRNRSSGEVRKIFEKGGGNMGAPGCVGYLFERKGIFVVDGRTIDEDGLMSLILDAGADDLTRLGDTFEITCDVTIFMAVSAALAKANLTPISADVAMLPKTQVEVDLETGKKLVKLLDALDDHEDVQNVYSNAKLTAEMSE